MYKIVYIYLYVSFISQFYRTYTNFMSFYILGETGRRVGTCVRDRHETKPCGSEAACRQLDPNTYFCVCPHDSSPPTEDLKCPKRITGKL